MGLVLPVCTAHSTGAATKAAVFPVDSFSTSPRETFSTRTVNRVAPGASCAAAACASARAAATSEVARIKDIGASCQDAEAGVRGAVAKLTLNR
jgi:hypothetical protein